MKKSIYMDIIRNQKKVGNELLNTLTIVSGDKESTIIDINNFSSIVLPDEMKGNNTDVEFSSYSYNSLKEKINSESAGFSLQLSNVSRWIKKDEATIVDASKEFKVTRKGASISEKKISTGDWEYKEDKNNCSLFFCGVLFISEKESYHEFPMRGDYVKSKKGANLFFVNEEKGKNEASFEESKERGRFYTDEVIAHKLKAEGNIHVGFSKREILRIK